MRVPDIIHVTGLKVQLEVSSYGRMDQLFLIMCYVFTLPPPHTPLPFPCNSEQQNLGRQATPAMFYPSPQCTILAYPQFAPTPTFLCIESISLELGGIKRQLSGVVQCPITSYLEPQEQRVRDGYQDNSRVNDKPYQSSWYWLLRSHRGPGFVIWRGLISVKKGWLINKEMCSFISNSGKFIRPSLECITNQFCS